MKGWTSRFLQNRERRFPSQSQVQGDTSGQQNALQRSPQHSIKQIKNKGLIKLKIFFNLFVCMSAQMYVQVYTGAHTCQGQKREGIGSLGAGACEMLSLPCGCWHPNSSPALGDLTSLSVWSTFLLLIGIHSADCDKEQCLWLLTPYSCCRQDEGRRWHHTHVDQTWLQFMLSLFEFSYAHCWYNLFYTHTKCIRKAHRAAGNGTNETDTNIQERTTTIYSQSNNPVKEGNRVD